MKQLDLVLRHNGQVITTIENYPVIPTLGHLFTLKLRGLWKSYEVTETASVINLEEKIKPGEAEAVRVEVTPH